MDLREAIVIISVFGRGNYLASELVKMGIPVTLLDVSHHMGPWYPEDIEGPFGFFQISESQWERLKSDELTLTQAEGFCLWLKTGPLQFRSLNAQHRFSALGFEHLLAQFIEKENLNKEQLKNLAKLPFEKKWLAHLACYLTQSTESSSSESIKWNEVSSNGINQMTGLRNFFHEFSFRKASNLGVARGLS